MDRTVHSSASQDNNLNVKQNFTSTFQGNLGK